MPSDLDFTAATAGLRDLGGQRVWSLMVSLFGDLAQAEGQAIEGPVLSAMMALLQVKPEAARVALHRLRNDGWLTSKKAGRISLHSLTAQGRAESAAASPRIYADPDGGATDWQMILLEEHIAGLQAQGWTKIQPRLFVGPAALIPPKDAVQLTPRSIPMWLKEQIAPRHLDDGYQSLLAAIETLEAHLQPPAQLTPIEIAVLRGLIVHNWRRLVLKHPSLPQPLIDPDSVSHQCHRRIAALLTRFPRPALSEIEPQHTSA